MNRTARTTRTDTQRIPAVTDEDTTVEIRPPWLRPPVPVTYSTRQARRRLRDTALAAHVTASASAAFYPLAIGCGLLVGFAASHL